MTAKTHGGIWTDHKGDAHGRRPGNRKKTFCGMNAGESNRVVSARPCKTCMKVSVRIQREADAQNRFELHAS